ncbi:MAG: hypothetical protein U9R28_01825 [Pseudomonadota bacterium]|nr:hypothetical protein [Pseudomonadota bacterium]
MTYKVLFSLGLAGLLQSTPVIATQALPNLSSQMTPVLTPLTLNLSAEDYRWIGQKIYQNECASQAKYLTHWGKGEDFPSFGIGHFIWFPANVDSPFEETFPALVKYLSKTQIAPSWLRQLNPLDSPWNSKKQFDQAWSEAKLSELRNWLLNTQPQQAEFIVQQFLTRWNKVVISLPIEEIGFYQNRLDRLLQSKKGTFAVIDYVNFKGMGGNAKEQYQGQEWGLLSVLKSMEVTPGINADQRLESFIFTAKQRLILRTELAPKQRNEQRWLKGWFKRLEGYK